MLESRVFFLILLVLKIIYVFYLDSGCMKSCLCTSGVDVVCVLVLHRSESISFVEFEICS